jgi:hypothetical protein
MYYLKERPTIESFNNICPPNNICFKTKYFIIILILSFVLILYIYIKIIKYKQINNDLINNKQINNKQINNKQINNKQINKQINNKQINNDLINNDITNNDITNNDIINTKQINNLLPVYKYLEYRDKSILYDPLVAPERRVPHEQYPYTIKNLINIPTRGYPDNYQLIGLLYRDNDEKIVQLYGRPTFPGSNEYEYYATTEQNGFTNKIPFRIKGNREIEDQQHIEIPILKGTFKVKLYNYDTPRYYP